MANNFLTQFPISVIKIEHLTVLSLRGNRLEEISPSIGAMKNLQTLNIAQNSLRYLPGELLDLMRKGTALRELQIHPNPFVQAEDNSFYRWGLHEYEEQTYGPEPKKSPTQGYWVGLTAKMRARTPVQFSDSSRVVYSDFALLDTTFGSGPGKLRKEDLWELAMPKAADSRRRPPGTDRLLGSKGPPSLFELALRAAVQAPEADQLASMLTDDDLIPDHLPSVMERAVHIHKQGGQKCCICGRETLNPMTEWIEFREIEIYTISSLMEVGDIRTEVTSSKPIAKKSDELWVPFMRRGCSWVCVPQKVQAPPSLEQRWAAMS
jgi:Leucine rich repeat